MKKSKAAVKELSEKLAEAKEETLSLKESDLDSLEEVVNRLSLKVKKLVKKNGFSQSLKKKAEVEL